MNTRSNKKSQGKDQPDKDACHENEFPGDREFDHDT